MRISILLTCLALALPSAAHADAKTQRHWKAKCAACHGDDGKGQTDAGKKLGVSDMSQAAWQKKLTDDQMKTSIGKGIKEKRAGKDVEMPAFPDLQPAEVDALVAMVRGFGK
jgi:mono/diheme cytochrome c family protein